MLIFSNISQDNHLETVQPKRFDQKKRKENNEIVIKMEFDDSTLQEDTNPVVIKEEDVQEEDKSMKITLLQQR